MTFFVSELRRRVFHPVSIVCCIMCGLVASYCGPFGTYEDQIFPDRSFYWFTLIAVSIVVAHAVRITLEKLFPKLSHLEQELAATLAFSVVYTPLVWEFTVRWVSENGDIGITPSAMFGFVLLISMFVSVLILVFSQTVEAKVRAAPAIMARLPKADSGQILSLCAQDHYVHVVTETGRFPLLMRFADAISELDGVEGVQVHRSYWVARKAVEGAVRRNGRHYVTLIDGSEVPVSRSYRRNAESAGLI